MSRRRREAFKAQSEPIPIGKVPDAIWQMYRAAMEPLEGFKHWAIVLSEQALGYMEPIVGIDADQMGVKGGMMDFRQRDAVGHDWLSEPLVLVGDDVGGVKEQGLW